MHLFTHCENKILNSSPGVLGMFTSHCPGICGYISILAHPICAHRLLSLLSFKFIDYFKRH